MTAKLGKHLGVFGSKATVVSIPAFWNGGKNLNAQIISSG
jgi:hypothetical protein